MSVKKTTKLDINLSLLRMLMCFGVVLSHSCRNKLYTSIYFVPFRIIQQIAAPTFMLLSFYFSYNTIFSKDNNLYKKRLIRLLIPQIIWAIIYWIILLPVTNPPVKELFWQMITGHSELLNPAMWYQFDLIVLTILYFVTAKLFKKENTIRLYVVFLIIAMILQYTNINYDTFNSLSFNLSYPLGRLAEMIPYATLGILLRHYPIINKIKKYRYPILFVSLYLIMFFYSYELPFDIKGFNYPGISFIIQVLMIFIAAKMFPFEIFLDKIKSIFIIISKYTLGIYCMHHLILSLIRNLLPDLFTRTFTFSICIYLICYVISYLISLIPNKTVKMLVD